MRGQEQATNANVNLRTTNGRISRRNLNHLHTEYDYDKDEKARALILRRFSLFNGTGADLRGCEDYEIALNAAELNFDVIQAGVNIADGAFAGTPLVNRKVNLRADTGEDLGFVTDRYKPIQHKDAFSICDEVYREGIAKYEIGGVGRGSHDTPKSSTGFITMRHPDIEVNGEQHQAFSFYRNTFDGSGGLIMKFVMLRLVCMNGLSRQYESGLGTINIRHTTSSEDKIKVAKQIMIKHESYIRAMKTEADILMKTPFSKQMFETEIVPLIMQIRGIKEYNASEAWERKRGTERVEELVQTVLTAYNAEDTQNYNGTAYKILLTMSDLDSHLQNLRNTNNSQVYMNRVLEIGTAQALLNPVMNYILKSRGIKLKLD